jgi:hypothetical protein
MNIRPLGAEFFHADEGMDGRTDRHDEANSHFSQILRTRLKRNSLTSELYRTSSILWKAGTARSLETTCF